MYKKSGNEKLEQHIRELEKEACERKKSDYGSYEQWNRVKKINY